MIRPAERLLLGLVIAGLALLLVCRVLRPAARRMDALGRRIEAAGGAIRSFIPVSAEERAVLEAPGAPWRTRIVRLEGDGARLAHMERVVRELGAALEARALRAAAFRATWDPVVADCTLPGGRLQRGPALPAPAAGDGPERQLGGWVLEVEIAGTAADLFRALAVVPAVNPLLEPVGLRWEAAADRAGPRQTLLLRNVFLKP